MEDRALELYNEGYYYYSGENDYPVDYEKAFEFFQESAALGCVNAMNYLGVMYESGEGVAPNLSKAFYWFSQAAEGGDAYGNYHVGRFYLEGIYVAQNEEKAMEYFVESCNIELNPYAAYPLGYAYLEENDFKTAAELFSCAANELDMPEAWHNFGWSVLNGGGSFAANSDGAARQAAIFYKKAADQGYPPSMDEYGRMLITINGQITPEAKGWIKRAADAGYEPAIKRMRTFNFGRFFGL